MPSGDILVSELGRYLPKVDKIMQPMGIILLDLAGLSGFTAIRGKKCA